MSRLTGLLRVVAIAAVLGPTYFGNIYQATNTIPNIAFEMLIGPLFVSLLVPTIVNRTDSGDGDVAARILRGFLGLTLTLFGIVAILLVLAGQLLVTALTVGVTDTSISNAQRAVALPLLALFMPQLLLYAIIGCCIAAQQSRGSFALPAAAPAFENLTTIAVMVGYKSLFDGESELTSISAGHLLWLGCGTTGAVLAHASVQWYGARRVGITLYPRWGASDPDVRAILKLAYPSLGFAGANALRTLVILIFAGGVPGGVVAFQLAYNFYTLSDAVIGRPIAQATLPSLARSYAARNLQEFRDILVRSIRVVLFLTVPIGILYIVVPDHIAQIVSTGEMASPSGLGLISDSLIGLAIGSVASAVLILVIHASYARRNALRPTVAVSIRAVTLGSVLVAWILLDIEHSVLALGLITSASDILALLILAAPFFGERRKPGGLRVATNRWAFLLAAGTALAVGSIASYSLDRQSIATVSPAHLALTLLFVASSYIATHMLLHSHEMILLSGWLKNRRRPE
ncbi:murein biosynthesis integral membrane protein MurJ [Pseudonocardia kongjuensis]|uniref:murein biosynthesis integral membrane protein MurJ n=1 Tax=Pseudonocardia kongjuensis TaxID=102227 RepID=UPI0031DAD32D